METERKSTVALPEIPHKEGSKGPPPPHHPPPLPELAARVAAKVRRREIEMPLRGMTVSASNIRRSTIRRFDAHSSTSKWSSAAPTSSQ